jgi:hypothetical protein
VYVGWLGKDTVVFEWVREKDTVVGGHMRNLCSKSFATSCINMEIASLGFANPRLSRGFVFLKLKP